MEHKLAFTIAETCRATGLGRTSVYGLIRSGNLEKFVACGRSLITASSLTAYIERARVATSSIAAVCPAPAGR